MKLNCLRTPTSDWFKTPLVLHLDWTLGVYLVHPTMKWYCLEVKYLIVIRMCCEQTHCNSLVQCRTIYSGKLWLKTLSFVLDEYKWSEGAVPDSEAGRDSSWDTQCWRGTTSGRSPADTLSEGEHLECVRPLYVFDGLLSLINMIFQGFISPFVEGPCSTKRSQCQDWCRSVLKFGSYDCRSFLITMGNRALDYLLLLWRFWYLINKRWVGVVYHTIKHYRENKTWWVQLFMQCFIVQ